MPTVKAERTVSESVVIDVVKLFASLSQDEQRRYWEIDVDDLGYGEEDRALAYVWDLLDGEDDWSMLAFQPWVIRADSDCDDMGVDEPRTKTWRDDLMIAVPWLIPTEADPEDLKRVPGPWDVPLFTMKEASVSAA